MKHKFIPRIQRVLDRLPRYLLTIVTTVIILELTLDPDPFGDHKPRLFEGADKVAHALMFGFLTIMILLDHSRARKWRPASTKSLVAAATIATAFGCLIEFLQMAMALGRGFEVADMVADLTGSVLAAAVWKICQTRFLNER